VAQCLLEELRPAFLVRGLLGLNLGLQVDRVELLERRQRPVDADDRLREPFALLVADLAVFDLLSALEALPAEVLFRPLDSVALTCGNRLPAFDLEDEVLEFDSLTLDCYLLGNLRAHRRTLPVDALDELLSLELFHTLM
jgi:hypothetical protein